MIGQKDRHLLSALIPKGLAEYKVNTHFIDESKKYQVRYVILSI